MMNAFSKVMILTSAVFAAGVLRARPVPGTPFADHMVLQRDRAVPVWGSADAGETVTVEFAGAKVSAKADAKGAWRVNLPPMAACAESRAMKIVGASDSVEISDVLVGEVWFASGQSNMECPIWGPNPRFRDANGGVVTRSTRRPAIRFVRNDRVWAAEPRHGWKAVWRDFSPESFAAAFRNCLSAVGFYYALELHDALRVPVGIVDSTWGGTNIDAWTPRSAYASHPELAETAAFPVTSTWNDSMRRGVISGANQQPSALWNGMVAAWAPFAIRGFIWYQGCSNNGEAFIYREKMHALYDGWSREFENPELRLYFAQLAPFSCSWFDLQLAQAAFAAEEKNAAIAVICDAGNSWDIHPNGKEIVGRRLALHALKRDYGFEEIIDDSPTLVKHSVADGAFRLEFSDAKRWYVYNADRSGVQGFEVAGPDGAFRPAKVMNAVNGEGSIEGSALVVAAEGVAEPKRLRYLASRPWIGALYSFDSGLPLGPFEIDDRDFAAARRPGASAAPGDALKIPELKGFRVVYAFDIPAGGNAADVPYRIDRSAGVGEVKRVAWALELEHRDGTVDWVTTIADPFRPSIAEMGVPAKSGATFSCRVKNLTVRSDMAAVEDVTDYDGGSVEFFNTNYGMNLMPGESDGDGSKYDFNDTPDRSGKPGHGCMQFHDRARGRTIWAYNSMRSSAELGIGPCPGLHPDWTSSSESGTYRSRRLTILVK